MGRSQMELLRDIAEGRMIPSPDSVRHIAAELVQIKEASRRQMLGDLRVGLIVAAVYAIGIGAVAAICKVFP